MDIVLETGLTLIKVNDDMSITLDLNDAGNYLTVIVRNSAGTERKSAHIHTSTSMETMRVSAFGLTVNADSHRKETKRHKDHSVVSLKTPLNKPGIDTVNLFHNN